MAKNLLARLSSKLSDPNLSTNVARRGFGSKWQKTKKQATSKSKTPKESSTS